MDGAVPARRGGHRKTGKGWSVQVLTCGVVGHVAECLCDVILGEPTPINFGLTDVWHGEAVARAMGVGVPWTSATVAEYTASLLAAYDLWRSRGVNRGEAIETEVLRHKVCDLLRAGESIVDVARMLDVDFKSMIHAMTNHVPATCWGWSEAEWLAVEAIIFDHFRSRSAEQLAAMIGPGVHHCVVDELAVWYDVSINADGAERQARMRGLLSDGWHPKEVAIEMRANGFDVSNEQVYMVRKRMANNGEVGSLMPPKGARPVRRV